MGIILNASKSVKEVFGYDRNLVRSLNINKLMPKSMHEEHDNILKNWAISGSWQNIARLRSIFALNSRQICFSTNIYLKIIQKTDRLSLLGAFFLVNDKDYMLINPSGFVEGAGKNFMELLGHKIVGLHLKEICESYE